MWLRFPSIRLWLAQVIETPEARRTEVLSSGTSRGLSGECLLGVSSRLVRV